MSSQFERAGMILKALGNFPCRYRERTSPTLSRISHPHRSISIEQPSNDIDDRGACGNIPVVDAGDLWMVGRVRDVRLDVLELLGLLRLLDLLLVLAQLAHDQIGQRATRCGVGRHEQLDGAFVSLVDLLQPVQHQAHGESSLVIASFARVPLLVRDRRPA